MTNKKPPETGDWETVYSHGEKVNQKEVNDACKKFFEKRGMHCGGWGKGGGKREPFNYGSKHE
jgi:hypothetical protein|tara:strand:- start:686 stop:874 length:189 start_codon:yes stop_codon:yes gene_type:complete